MSDAPAELVRYAVADAVATITLDSQHNRNALSRRLVTELFAHLEAAQADDAVRVVLIRAEGDVGHGARAVSHTVDLAADQLAFLAGQLGVAVIAYAGHFLYGWPLGKFVQHLDNTDRDLRETFRYPTAIVLGLAVFAILLWQQPWHHSDVRKEAGRLADEAGRPVLLVAVGEAFTPEFARIRPGECVLIVNRTDTAFAPAHGDVPAQGETDFCFDTAGVKRVRLSSEPFSGGFVYVDDN